MATSVNKKSASFVFLGTPASRFLVRAHSCAYESTRCEREV